MKSFIVSMALLASMPVFANGVEDCKALLGNYKCSSEGETVSLEIIGNITHEAIKIDIGGEAEHYYIDGKPQLANDDSVVIVECRGKKEIAVDKVTVQRKPLYSVLKTVDGVQMISGNKDFTLNCKNK